VPNPADDALDAAILQVALDPWANDENGTPAYLGRQTFVAEGAKRGASPAEVADSLEILCKRGDLQQDRGVYSATHRAQRAYLKSLDATYDETYERVAVEVAKHEHMVRNWAVARTLGLSHRLANHFLFELCARGEAKKDGETGGGGGGGLRFYVTPTAELRRRFRGAQ
jgi:hypothetical protein